jgi:CheY-like chemotaxis protein
MSPEILLVEDNAADVRLTQEVVRKSQRPANLHVARDGEQAIRMLKREGEYRDLPLPDLILLDLNLPRKDGREVLAEIKQDPQLMRIPVVILTTSKAEGDIASCYGLHANSYITKPVDLTEFEDVIRGLQKYWFGMVLLAAKK